MVFEELDTFRQRRPRILVERLIITMIVHAGGTLGTLKGVNDAELETLE